jgi:hypothetical protein
MPAVVIAAVLALLGLTLPATPAHAMQRVPGAVLAVTVESEPSYGPDGPSFDRETISTIDSRTGRIRALASGYGPRFFTGRAMDRILSGGTVGDAERWSPGRSAHTRVLPVAHMGS